MSSLKSERLLLVPTNTKWMVSRFQVAIFPEYLNLAGDTEDRLGQLSILHFLHICTVVQCDHCVANISVLVPRFYRWYQLQYSQLTVRCFKFGIQNFKLFCFLDLKLLHTQSLVSRQTRVILHLNFFFVTKCRLN